VGSMLGASLKVALPLFSIPGGGRFASGCLIRECRVGLRIERHLSPSTLAHHDCPPVDGLANRNTAAATTQVHPRGAPSTAAVIDSVSTMRSLCS
jgi:hypothetical protein